MSLTLGPPSAKVDTFAEVLKSTALARLDTPGNVPGAWMNPAANYATTCYVRDSFWTQIGLGNAAISRSLLARFGSYIGAGSTPNRAPLFVQQDGSHNVTAGSYFSYDDTNALLLMWEAWHRQRFGAAVLTNTQLTNLAAGITANLTADNWWKDESATATLGFGWLDSLTNPGPATLTSALNQGLSWVALSCAAQLGVTVSGTVLAGLLTNYQSLYQTDHVATYKDRGAGTYPDWIDVISIMPEFWAKYLLGQAMLTDAQVAAHMGQLFASNVVTVPGGRAFKCIARRDGSYLAATLWKSFVPGGAGQPAGGVYQNGGSWLLHDFFALAVGRLHGYTGNDLDAMWTDRAAAEFGVDVVSHEQINTSSAGQFALGSCSSGSFTYGWNAAILGLESFSGLRRS